VKGRPLSTDQHLRSDLYANPALWGEYGKAVLFGRGCPFRCSFCQGIGQYEKRDPENIITEAEQAVRQFGFKTIDLIDGVVFLPGERLVKIAEMWRRSPILRDVKVSGCGKFGDKLLDPDVYAAWDGLYDYVFMSIEAGSDNVLSQLNKLFTIDDIFDGLRFLRKYKIPAVVLTAIVGFPFETVQDVRDLETVLRFAELELTRNGMEPRIGTGIIVPYFGTEVGHANRVQDYNPASEANLTRSFWYDLSAQHKREILQFMKRW
jgi:radical SAM superfamily enzyme YgiQ (UPF0313 family)